MNDFYCTYMYVHDIVLLSVTPSKHICQYRNPEVVCVEGDAAELLQHLHHVPHRPRHVLLLQQAEGGGHVQGEQVQGLHHKVHGSRQGDQLSEF